MAETAFLGENLIVWLLLALGGALFAGNLLALSGWIALALSLAMVMVAAMAMVMAMMMMI